VMYCGFAGKVCVIVTFEPARDSVINCVGAARIVVKVRASMLVVTV
jgi:hypothetical protein